MIVCGLSLNLGELSKHGSAGTGLPVVSIYVYIDALKVIAEGVNSSRDNKKAFLVITHYQRLLDYIKPDYVHVLSNGKIIKSGNSELAHELEKKGYKKIN